jgi:tetratricopeptide (TPR) repeat protein
MTPADEVHLQTLRNRIARTGIDRFLKRAAMLHTDVTLFHPDVHLTTREGTGHLATDGRSEGDLGRPWHYMLARSFLYLVLWDKDVPRLTVRKTEPDPEVLLWYQAVGNELWRQRNYTEALPHIRAALDLFPGDAELQFVSGVIHESQSGTQLQAAVQEQVAAFRGRRERYIPGVGTADAERDEAEDAFRAAIAADPGHLEARLRLAQVLNVDGEYDEAVRELTLVLERTKAPWHRYFALLFLGRAEEGRGHPDEARHAYESASGLFPDAQAPRMAISQIDMQAGRRADAVSVFQFLSRERPFDADPWWQYDAVRDPSDDWISRLRAAFAEATR